jgi:hypothetical protein
MSNNEIKQEIEELRSEIERIKNRNEISFVDILKNMLNRFSVITGIITVVVISSLIIYAATITKPHPDFSSGGLIEADKINDNFNTLYTAVNRTGKLIDDSGNILGRVTNAYVSGVDVMSPNGYLVQYNWDGTLWSETTFYYEDVADCSSGNIYHDASYLSAPYGKFTAYHKTGDKNYIPDSIETNGLASTTTSVTYQSSYSSVTNSCTSTGGTITPAILLKEASLTEMGLPESVTLPLTIE